jgi:hypothetical protein
MRSDFRGIPALLFVFSLLCNTQISSASEWRTVDLSARPLNIIENHGTLWICGADELIAASTDGGKTWTVKHKAKNGGLLLTVGFANDQFGYAAGTGGAMIVTKDGGTTWDQVKVPSPVTYSISFSDEKHGLIHTPRTVFTTNDGGATWVPVKIDLQSDDLKGFSFVLQILSLDPNHMAIVLSEGNSHANDYRLLISKDSGLSWKMVEIPSTGLATLMARGGEYWFAGMEVIEKDKPGGGYGVPVVMHSPDGENWTHLPRWSKNEFSECNLLGCLFWDGAGVPLPPVIPVSFWTFPPEKAVTAKWAVAKDNICSVGTTLRCAVVTTTQIMPAYTESSSPIAPFISAPPLDARASPGLQCIYCDFERIMVTSDYQGVADVEMKIYIGQNGLIEKTEIIHATNPGIGDRIAASARTWIFVPFMKDGIVHPANTTVKLRVQAIKSK